MQTIHFVLVILFYNFGISASNQNGGLNHFVEEQTRNAFRKQHLTSDHAQQRNDHNSNNQHADISKQFSSDSFQNGKFADEDAAMATYLSRKHSQLESPLAGVTCVMCGLAVTQIQSMLKNDTDFGRVVNEAIKICISLKIQDDRICKMIVHEFQDEIRYVLTHLVLSPQEACGIVLGSNCSTPYHPGNMWNVTLPTTPKPKPSPPRPPKPNAPKLKFLQITDIHIDFQYKAGSSVYCHEPLCCHEGNITDVRKSQFEYHVQRKAGKYGDYHSCDSPLPTVVSMFQHLNSIKDQFDYVIFTGDIPAHNVWNQSRSDQLEHLNTLSNLFTKYLPDKPVHFCVGNHETAPINSFPPPWVPNQDMGWLYGAMAEVYMKWLPQSAVETILRCGSYSMSPYPGFRIISVNTNYCNRGNWWLLLNETDPCDQLQWLIKELQKAEDIDEKVHILTHIPPGEGTCLKAWSHNYYKIINRYENTIVNQFYGHSHKDWFEMFYDDVTFKRPLGMGFVAPSVTPYSLHGLNPSFRIYTADGSYPGSSWAVLDYHGYYMNLTTANIEDKPVWELSYSPKQMYNMTNLYAADWEDFIQRMEKDDKLFQTFYRNYYTLHPTSQCLGQCKTNLLCDLKEGRSDDPHLCQIH